MDKIISLTLSVTTLCNSHCIQCDIWNTSNIRKEQQLTLTDYEGLFKSFGNRNLKNIAITGGEPSLYEDLEELVDIISIYFPNVRLVLNTNANSKKIFSLDLLKKLNTYNFNEVLINVSLDGTEKIHDSNRGIVGAFNNAIEFIRFVKSNFHKIKISLNFTVLPYNFTEVQNILQLSKSLQVGFTMRYGQNSFFYNNASTIFPWNEDDLINSALYFRETAEKLKDQNKNSLSAHILFILLAPYYLTKNRDYDCFALQDSMYIDSTGNIYPCIMLNEIIGNIKNHNINNILNSELALKVKRKIFSRQCHCWTECESMNSIINQKDFFSNKISQIC